MSRLSASSAREGHSAEWLISSIAGTIEPLATVMIIGGVYVLTSALTDIMANAAAAPVRTLVALNPAGQ